MNQIIITNQNQSFRITISDIKKIDTYYQFQLSIKSSVFLVSTIARAWTEEWFNWKEGLKEMAEKKVKSIHFSPLGEYWNILFELKEENIISIKGSISDLEREQSNLEFGGSISICDLQAAL